MNATDNITRAPDLHNFPSRLASVIGEESVNSFARRVGCSEAVFRAYLHGRKLPGMKYLVRIAEVGGVTVDWLATGRNASSSTEQERKIIAIMDGAFTLIAHAREAAEDLLAKKNQSLMNTPKTTDAQ